MNPQHFTVVEMQHNRAEFEYIHDGALGISTAFEIKEKAEIKEYYPDYSFDSTDVFRLEENISNYEKLTLVKDKDGKWKFNVRTYEREDGKSAVMVNSVYDVYWE